ncbi:ArsR/SmtB family transcription factor [Pseudanabaena yagii]|uniref:Winged helix-turn-helix transcriptional regulator n=1 Tax=Pseudanabaena yagii GIHE-NHR1 TaxID=2722753 RepID=A0ABX1LQD2_9CYAN|nr:metalloregulator ArsR/SmtB family transcription factor [Pseudanabaena yagii]NMF58323.1 winged helix-turn-helix transcriptional regulator [Pseudanabaena yagii GIHE-NHR1]
MAFEPSYFKADLFKVLSNPVRIQILDALRVSEQSVNSIAQQIEAEPSAVSQQLAVMRRYNLVRSRKQGNFVYYSVGDATIFKVLDAALELFHNHVIEMRESLQKLE